MSCKRKTELGYLDYYQERQTMEHPKPTSFFSPNKATSSSKSKTSSYRSTYLKASIISLAIGILTARK